MNFSKFKNFSFFIQIFLFIFYNLCFSEEIILNAENVIYDRQKNRVFAEDNVSVKFKDISLNASFLEYDLESNILYITTQTILSYQGSKLFLDSLVYDMNLDTITALGFYVYYKPWYSLSKVAYINRQNFLLKNAKVSHCEFKNPHYYFSSKKVLIIPKEKIKLYSPTLVIRKFPLLWMPYYEISLKPSKTYFIVEPGYDSYNGGVIKGKYGIGISKDSEFRLLIDYYFLGKVGLGGEFRYSSLKNIGVIYGYLVKDNSQASQWNFRINNTHKLFSFWSFKSNFEMLNDEKISYFYEKENWFLIKREINSSLSLSRDTQINSFRISYIRKDNYSQEKQRFENSFFKIPIQFMLYPFKVRNFVISEKINFSPEFIGATTYYKILTENNFNISFPKRVGFFSLTPSLEINSYYTSFPQNEVFYNLYSFNFPIKYNIFDGSLDLSYNYTIRSKENSFDIIFSSNVYKNFLSFRLDLFRRWYYFRTFSSYDFLGVDKCWLKNFSPLISDLGFNFKLLNTNFHTEYDVHKENIKSMNLSVSVIPNDNLLSISYGKNFDKDIEFISTQFIFNLLNKWQFKFKTIGNIKKDNFEIINSDFEIYRDLHCWETRIYLNTRKSLSTVTEMPYVFEVGGYIGLKFKPYRKPSTDLDKQFFPWRG